MGFVTRLLNAASYTNNENREMTNDGRNRSAISRKIENLGEKEIFKCSVISEANRKRLCIDTMTQRLHKKSKERLITMTRINTDNTDNKRTKKIENKNG